MKIEITEDDKAWLISLLNERIRYYHSSGLGGRGTWGAKWARELRALRDKIQEAAP